MQIADGHLDLAYNALRGRNVLAPALQQQPDEEGIPTVGLPDLRRGGASLICATIFCEPAAEGRGGYANAEEAAKSGKAQLDWYINNCQTNVFRMVRSAADLPSVSASDSPPAGAATFPPPGTPRRRAAVAAEGQGEGLLSAPGENPSPKPLPMVLLLEGADPMHGPQDIPWWFERGLRAVGLAWKQTRYAGGTRAPGPLTPAGVELAKALDAAGIVHDLSHLAEESFWQLLNLTQGPVMASHSNCRAFVPTDRQLSDDMIRAVIARRGVIGINFYDKFLLAPGEYGKRRASLSDVARHARHICELAGSAEFVAIGTDMDGGLGREQIPQEIITWADMPKVALALSAAGFSDHDVRLIMAENWLTFWRRSLPQRV